MTDDLRTPMELREIFGANLKRLARRYASVSDLCRQLGINRTQFNRYLSGESFPRPDVLDKICKFFDVDARILLAPLDQIPSPTARGTDELMTQFLGSGPNWPSTDQLPDGFYHAIETDPADTSERSHRLYHVSRTQSYTQLRAYAPRNAVDTPSEREARGFAACADGALYVLVASRGAADYRILALTSLSQNKPHRWSGVTLPLSGVTAAQTAGRALDLRHLGHDIAAALRVARRAT